MSLSVNASNSTNPFAYLQSLWQQQGTPASGTQAQSDPLSALLASITAQASSTTATAPGTAASSTATTSPSSTTSPQFGSQTLQALLALQANGANTQPLAAQFGTTATGDDPLAALQSQSSQSGHHHHHHSLAANGTNGQTSSAAADMANSSAGSSSGTGNNALYQLLQMQARLTPPAPAQSTTTA